MGAGLNFTRCRTCDQIHDQGEACQIERTSPKRSRVQSMAFASAADVVSEPKPEYLVQDLIFPAVPFSLFGLPGVGKSLVALLLAVCVATRRRFAGRNVNLEEPGSVIYVCAEGGDFLGSRLRAICEAHSIEQAELQHLHFFRRPVALTNPFEVEAFVDAVRQRLTNRPRCRLMFFDTVTRCLGRADANENDPVDTARLADRVDFIIEEIGAAVGLVDHTGWRSKHERGHSNKRSNVETAILVQALHDKSRIKLTCEKTNHDAGFKALHLQIERRADAAVVVPLKADLRPNPPTDEEALAIPLQRNDAAALVALAKEDDLSFTRWKNLADLRPASLDRARLRLLKHRLVEAHGPEHRQRYRLTELGRVRAIDIVSRLATEMDAAETEG